MTEWQWIAAVFLIVVSFPAWLPISIIWGFMKLVVTIVHLWPSDQGDHQSMGYAIGQAIGLSLVEGFYSIFTVPAAIWNWSVDYPTFAALAGVGLIVIGSLGNRARSG